MNKLTIANKCATIITNQLGMVVMDIIRNEDINFNNLKKLKCRANSESNLYTDGAILYKIFKELTPRKLKRKERKIELLNGGEKIDNIILPESKIINGNLISGYSMDYIKDSLILYEFTKKSKNINDFLKIIYEVSLTLRKIHNDPRDIAVGDLSFSNIIFDKNLKHYFVDMDGAMIDNIPSERISFLLNDYTILRGMYRFSIDKNSDIFSLMLCTLHTIFSIEIDKISMYDYDFVAEKNETLRNMREYVIEMKKKNNYIPSVPYMDEIIKLPSKQRIKIKK